ncbi:MAG: hypothetical protein U0V74_05230 [Chitinophagales bacterium]
MENQILDQPTATGKVYSLTQVYLATLFAGPITGGYLIAANFKTLGLPQHIWKPYLLAFLMLAFIIVSMFIPALDAIPPIVYVIAYTFGLSRMAQTMQDDKIDEFMAAGGETYNSWRVVVVGLIGIALSVVLIVGVTLLADL